MSQNDNKHLSGLTRRVWNFAELVLKNRFARALDEGAARYYRARDQAAVAAARSRRSPRK